MKKNLQIKVDEEEEEEKRRNSPSPRKTGRSTRPGMPVLDLKTPREPQIEIKTVVKREKDNELFITDQEEIDFDKLNDIAVHEIQLELSTEN